MSGPDLPDGDRIARYCRPGAVADGEPLPAAFMLRDDEDCLSVNWIEYWGAATLDGALASIRDDLSQDMTLSRNGLFAVLGVGSARAIAAAFASDPPTLTHEPTNVRSHASLCGLRPSHDVIAAALALAVSSTHPVGR